MPQETQNKADYIVIFISEFARRFGLSALQAYRYLNRYKAIDFLDDQYNVAHTQSFEDMVQNMAGYCQRHGLSIFLRKRESHSNAEALMSTIDYMNECTVRDLVLMLMEERGLTLHEALDSVYNSETYAKLMNPATGLYFQSPVYIFSYLDRELATGKL